MPKERQNKILYSFSSNPRIDSTAANHEAKSYSLHFQCYQINEKSSSISKHLIKNPAHPGPSSSKTQPTRRHAPQADRDTAGLLKLLLQNYASRLQFE
jgi:hypothetical protein